MEEFGALLTSVSTISVRTIFGSIKFIFWKKRRKIVIQQHQTGNLLTIRSIALY